MLKERGELPPVERKSRFTQKQPVAQVDNVRQESHFQGSNRHENYGGRREFGSQHDQNHGERREYYSSSRERNNGERRTYHANNFQSRDGQPYRERRPRQAKPAGEAGSQFDNKKFGSFDRTKKYINKLKKQPKQEQPTYENTHFVDYSKPMRLNRFLANAGKCSRREADEFIQAGVVTVNGRVVTELGSRVIPATDKVMFHDEPVKIEQRVYILLNKPKDYVTTAEDLHAKHTVLDLVRNACSERVYPVGRLDRNTTGVLLLTNDGELTSKLTHPSFNKKKIYQVTLDRDVTDEDIEKIKTGITLEDGDIKVDEISFVTEEDRRTVGVEIHSGRNRIVRRIFAALNYKVMRLDRVYFAGLTKKNLPRGRWRFLSEKEVAFLKMNANNPTENC